MSKNLFDSVQSLHFQNTALEAQVKKCMQNELQYQSTIEILKKDLGKKKDAVVQRLVEIATSVSPVIVRKLASAKAAAEKELEELKQGKNGPRA